MENGIYMHGARRRATCFARSSALMMRMRPPSKTCGVQANFPDTSLAFAASGKYTERLHCARSTSFRKWEARSYFGGNTAIASTSNNAPGRASCGTPIAVLAGGAALFTYLSRTSRKCAMFVPMSTI
jgi:hypothetical protein